jgi:hypothetical protein
MKSTGRIVTLVSYDKETTLKYIHLAKTNLRQEMVQTAL